MMGNITKCQRVLLLSKIRMVIAKELNKIIYIKKKYTGKEIAERCKMDAARISEILSARETVALSESTLRKLIRGGFVRVSELITATEPLMQEEKDYISYFVIYENQRHEPGLESLRGSVADLMSKLNELNELLEKGINISSLIQGELAGIAYKKNKECITF